MKTTVKKFEVDADAAKRAFNVAVDALLLIARSGDARSAKIASDGVADIYKILTGWDCHGNC